VCAVGRLHSLLIECDGNCMYLSIGSDAEVVPSEREKKKVTEAAKKTTGSGRKRYGRNL